MLLNERVAVITGGTRGIGRGIAEAFLAEGARVMLNGRSPEKGEATLAEINAGDRASYCAGDMTLQRDAERLIDETIARFGRLDILVNNAGGSDGFALVADLTDEAWNRALNLNLNAMFWCSRRALGHMAAQKWGRVITISSVEGKQANKAAVSHYIANKHAMNGLAKAIAFEYGPIGVTSNAICPGAIETDLMRDVGPSAAQTMGISYEQFLQNYANESMIKRLNRVEEVAAMAVLLASDVGGGITGALINVDGGTAAW
jgi:3-hydroxybutyrate dehydrogenase/3-oxoacyl-[acyl-carrier protein] reductase